MLNVNYLDRKENIWVSEKSEEYLRASVSQYNGQLL